MHARVGNPVATMMRPARSTLGFRWGCQMRSDAQGQAVTPDNSVRTDTVAQNRTRQVVRNYDRIEELSLIVVGFYQP